MDVLRFGLFELEPASGELKKAGIPVKLQLQPGKVLALLASEPGRLFTREEIQARVWGPDTQVDFEQGLNYCIKEIRAALGDRADTPRYVETLARRGYRFIAPVEVGRPPSDVPPTATAPRRRYLSPRLLSAVLVASALVAFAAAFLPRGAGSERLIIAVLPFENRTGSPDYDVFADGMTEEMQLQLGRLDRARLSVIARTTARGYANRPHPIGNMVDDLGVDYVLEGMVRHCRKHDRLRITARLVRASDRGEVWSDRWHNSAEDLVDTQRSAARMLAAGAGAALAQREPTRLTVVLSDTAGPKQAAQ